MWNYTAREGEMRVTYLHRDLCLHIYSKGQLRSKWAFPPEWLWEGKSRKLSSYKAPSGTEKALVKSNFNSPLKIQIYLHGNVLPPSNWHMGWLG